MLIDEGIFLSMQALLAQNQVQLQVLNQSFDRFANTSLLYLLILTVLHGFYVIRKEWFK